MPRMIDPDVLTRELERRKLSTGRLVQWGAAMDAAAVDMPDVVRCHECQFCRSVTYNETIDDYEILPYSGQETDWHCYLHEFNIDDDVMPENYFCASGARRCEDFCEIGGDH